MEINADYFANGFSQIDSKSHDNTIRGKNLLITDLVEKLYQEVDKRIKHVEALRQEDPEKFDQELLLYERFKAFRQELNQDSIELDESYLSEGEKRLMEKFACFDEENTIPTYFVLSNHGHTFEVILPILGESELLNNLTLEGIETKQDNRYFKRFVLDTQQEGHPADKYEQISQVIINALQEFGKKYNITFDVRPTPVNRSSLYKHVVREKLPEVMDVAGQPLLYSLDKAVELTGLNKEELIKKQQESKVHENLIKMGYCPASVVDQITGKEHKAVPTEPIVSETIDKTVEKAKPKVPEEILPWLDRSHPRKKYTLSQIEKLSGVNYKTLFSRVKRHNKKRGVKKLDYKKGITATQILKYSELFTPGHPKATAEPKIDYNLTRNTEISIALTADILGISAETVRRKYSNLLQDASEEYKNEPSRRSFKHRIGKVMNTSVLEKLITDEKIETKYKFVGEVSKEEEPATIPPEPDLPEVEARYSQIEIEINKTVGEDAASQDEKHKTIYNILDVLKSLTEFYSKDIDLDKFENLFVRILNSQGIKEKEEYMNPDSVFDAIETIDDYVRIDKKVKEEREQGLNGEIYLSRDQVATLFGHSPDDSEKWEEYLPIIEQIDGEQKIALDKLLSFAYLELKRNIDTKQIVSLSHNMPEITEYLKRKAEQETGELSDILAKIEGTKPEEPTEEKIYGQKEHIDYINGKLDFDFTISKYQFLIRKEVIGKPKKEDKLVGQNMVPVCVATRAELDEIINKAKEYYKDHLTPTSKHIIGSKPVATIFNLDVTEFQKLYKNTDGLSGLIKKQRVHGYKGEIFVLETGNIEKVKEQYGNKIEGIISERGKGTRGKPPIKVTPVPKKPETPYKPGTPAEAGAEPVAVQEPIPPVKPAAPEPAAAQADSIDSKIDSMLEGDEILVRSLPSTATRLDPSIQKRDVFRAVQSRKATNIEDFPDSGTVKREGAKIILRGLMQKT